jgi:hypothetical protein
VTVPGTPAPAYDVTELFPGIAGYARDATRLHPLPGRTDRLGSQVGGMPAWPADEPWPVCTAEHVVVREEPLPPPLHARLRELRGMEPARRWPGLQQLLAELADRAPGFTGIDRHTDLATYLSARAGDAPCPLVPLVQLRAADLPLPVDADLLQLLWCPNDHDLGEGALAPAVTVRWRNLDEVGTCLPAAPAPTSVGHKTYLPVPCVVRPEPVVEYPWWQQLPVELGYEVMVWDGRHGGLYHRQLAAAPGWKVGGWPRWPTTDPRTFYCPRCADPMPQLLQVDSGEWGDPARWRARGDAPPEPTGVIAGHTGLYRVFCCPSCPESVRVDLQ